jgi:hypothetical protein
MSFGVEDLVDRRSFVPMIEYAEDLKEAIYEY